MDQEGQRKRRRTVDAGGLSAVSLASRAVSSLFGGGINNNVGTGGSGSGSGNGRSAAAHLSPSASVSASGAGSSTSNALSLHCPICLDAIENAFMAKCGHSFCYNCIKTHLAFKPCCPTCASPVAEGEIYPNFSLNAIIANSKKSNFESVTTNAASAASADVNAHTFDDPADTSAAIAHPGSDSTSLKEIDSMLLALIEKRKLLESNEKEIQLSLLAQFLSRGKGRMERDLARVQSTLAHLTADLGHVVTQLDTLRNGISAVADARARELSTGREYGAGISGGVGESHNVPSTPVTVAAAAPGLARMDRSGVSLDVTSSVIAPAVGVCSSPLPPEMQVLTTPSGAAWGVAVGEGGNGEKGEHGGGNSVGDRITGAPLTGDVKSAVRFLGANRKRSHSAINNDTPPPLEFTKEQYGDASPASLSRLGAWSPDRERAMDDSMSRVVKTRMVRIERHFDNLLENYCSIRAAEAVCNSDGGGFVAQSPAGSGFGESLARLSRVSAFHTLARINYADKLVSGGAGGGGNGVGTGAGGSGSTSSIVSAIEFDRDDEFFATAGVTRKVKIYEFESVVRNWGEVFGGGGLGGAVGMRRRARGFVGGTLFVADALRDADVRSGGSECEENDEDTKEEDGLDEGDDEGDANSAVARYPILEMNGRSKISCLSWNGYIKSQLVASDYEGIVTLWDSTTGIATTEFDEHEKRAWSVDFNSVDPVLFASGSDDCRVKVWSTTQKGAVHTIESKANVCSVKWNPHSNHQLAFGSADHHIHYYDLRNSTQPLYILKGHKKAVSYVKFLNRTELVSASTDSTLKLWSLGNIEAESGSNSTPGVSVRGSLSGLGVGGSDSQLFAPLSSFIETNLTENIQSDIFRRQAASVLSLKRTPSETSSTLKPFFKSDIFRKQATSGLSLKRTPSKTSSIVKPFFNEKERPQVVRTFSGHQNEKNFVGLSVNCNSDFIACGSENNSVYTYFNSLSSPVIVHRFGNALDVASGEEVADSDPSHFVSSVCWKRKNPDVLVAANSVGGVKVMKMV